MRRRPVGGARGAADGHAAAETHTRLRAVPISVYAGLKNTPCCLCEETHTRIAVSPRALGLMKNGDPIAWRDVVGTDLSNLSNGERSLWPW